MLIAVGGLIAGYDGSFSFEKIGLEFPDNVPYVALRLVSCFHLLLSFSIILSICYLVHPVLQYVLASYILSFRAPVDRSHMGRSILAVLLATILTISRMSINPTTSTCQLLFIIFAPHRPPAA